MTTVCRCAGGIIEVSAPRGGRSGWTAGCRRSAAPRGGTLHSNGAPRACRSPNPPDDEPCCAPDCTRDRLFPRRGPGAGEGRRRRTLSRRRGVPGRPRLGRCVVAERAKRVEGLPRSTTGGFVSVLRSLAQRSVCGIMRFFSLRSVNDRGASLPRQAAKRSANRRRSAAPSVTDAASTCPCTRSNSSGSKYPVVR